MIAFNQNSTAEAHDLMDRLQAGLTPQALDTLVEKVAFQTEASIKEATPVRFEGQVRRAWSTLNPGPGPDGSAMRVVRNEATTKDGLAIMVFLESGTANDGSGYIEPKVKKFLYIPLTRRAAGGWRAGLKWGVDFILKRRVRGIKGRHFVAAEVPKVQQRLRDGMSALISSILNKGTNV